MSSAANLLGDGTLVLWGNINPSQVNEADLNDWWTNEHLPERLRLPGFLRARRYRALTTNADSHGYLALYEASEVSSLSSPEYMSALNNPTPRTKKFMPCLAAMTRCACGVLGSWSSLASAEKKMELVALGVFRRQSDEVVERKSEETLPALCGNISKLVGKWRGNGVVAIHFVRDDEKTTRAGSTSKSYDGVTFASQERDDGADTSKRYIVVVEFSTTDAHARVLDSEAVAADVTRLVERCGGREMAWQHYSLICSMEENEVNEV